MCSVYAEGGRLSTSSEIGMDSILVTFKRWECKGSICQLRRQIFCYECNTSVAREITGKEKKRLLKRNKGARSFVGSVIHVIR